MTKEHLSRKKLRRKKQHHGDEAALDAEPALVQRAIDHPGKNTLTPEVVLQLQALHGNQFVQRLMNRAAWENDSELTTLFGKYTYDRSDALRLIDERVGDYDLVRDSEDLKARYNALFNIKQAILAWRADKANRADRAKRWPAIRRLGEQVDEELAHIEDLKGQRRAENEAAAAEIIPEIVTEEIRAIVAPAARAKAVFESFMDYFRGDVQYTLKTIPDMTLYSSAGTVACATIATGLVEALRYAGIDSKVIQIPERYFITKPIGEEFIDQDAIGNVFRTGGTYEAEKRFFFTAHWIVSAPGANLHFDPTSGIEVDAKASEIIDPELTQFTTDGINYLKGDRYRLITRLDAAPSGSGYELMPIDEGV